MHALRQRFRLIRMRPGQAFGARHQFVDPRVVLHGAGTQRIHAVIDGVVPGGKAREVADGFHFAHFGEACDFRAHVVRAERLGRIDRGHIELGKLVGFLAGRTALEQQRLHSARGAGDFVILLHSIIPTTCRQLDPYPLRACDISVAQSSMRVRQFRIEAAQRQAADDFFLQQRFVDFVGRAFSVEPRIR